MKHLPDSRDTKINPAEWSIWYTVQPLYHTVYYMYNTILHIAWPWQMQDINHTKNSHYILYLALMGDVWCIFFGVFLLIGQKSEWNFRCNFQTDFCNWWFRHNFQTAFSDWWLRHLLWNCPNMNVTGLCWWSVNIGSGNGLVPSGNKPLPEPMLTQISVAILRH